MSKSFAEMSSCKALRNANQHDLSANRVHYDRMSSMRSKIKIAGISNASNPHAFQSNFMVLQRIAGNLKWNHLEGMRMMKYSILRSAKDKGCLADVNRCFNRVITYTESYLSIPVRSIDYNYQLILLSGIEANCQYLIALDLGTMPSLIRYFNRLVIQEYNDVLAQMMSNMVPYSTSLLKELACIPESKDAKSEDE
jgi:hypothetical protein